MHRRVAITGMGVVSSLGLDTDSFFNNIVNGKSGISPITSFDTSNHSVKIAGEVNINLEDYFSTKEINKMDRFSAFALLLMVSVSACRETTEEKTEDAMESAADDMGDAMEDAGDAVEEAAEDTEAAVEEGAQEVEDEVEGNDDM